MKISFVVPAFNEESQLGGCLESLYKEIHRVEASQTNLMTEVIVVNNASTDRTKEVAQGFFGVKVVDESQKGLVRARAAGQRVATGELVANIDSDVRLPEGWLTTVLGAFERDPKLVCISGPFIYYDLSAWDRAMVRFFYGWAFFLYFLIRFVLRVGSMVQGGNFVVRKSAMDAAGGYDTTIAFYGEDTDVARRLSALGKVKWTFALPVYTSGRRLKGEGIVLTSLRYTANYFWVTFTGRPFSSKYKDVRPE